MKSWTILMRTYKKEKAFVIFVFFFREQIHLKMSNHIMILSSSLAKDLQSSRHINKH